MIQETGEIIKDLRSYLEYMKGLGIEELPVSEGPKKVPHTPSVLPRANFTLEEVRKELGDCRRCKLHRTRRNLVFGEGDEKAKLMFIGEGPGYDEDVQGRPFVGRAGQLLTRIIQSIKLQREEVYITNVIKCRPPQNRNPDADEIRSCEPFLFRQIRVIRPRVICALGTFAAQTLLKSTGKITALRGKSYEVEGIRIVPTYHPAFLLRNPDKKKEAWEDMKRVLDLLRTEPEG